MLRIFITQTQGNNHSNFVTITQTQGNNHSNFVTTTQTQGMVIHMLRIFITQTPTPLDHS
jgi:hypothetical protein